ncbi:MAG TPA: NAD(P)-binding domain-containing protein [Acidimicrobiia bacterium]|nr:NAD(P)-binding domain-containing protein [Acidimicrobiia bacterium]
MIIVDSALAKRQMDGNPIRVGVVGAGYMGKGMTRQMIESMVGMDVVAIANRTVDRAAEVFEACGVGDTVVQASSQAEVDRALEKGQRVVVSDPVLLCRTPSVEAILEATGEVEYGARTAVAAIEGRKHLILVNAELDATVGPILKVMADEAGVVISNADGDEPAVAMNLVRFVRSIGYRPVLAGNVKGFYDPHRNPETQLGFANQHGQRAKMVTSFADGTKMSMEASVLVNATGFSVAQRGMTGHRCAHVKDVLELFDLDALLQNPLVDYVLGAEPGSGAFVVGFDDDKERRAYMQYFKMGEGPFHVFYRPFHLTHLEAPLSVARAVLFGDAAIAPSGPPRAEVVTFAKTDLESGAILDGIGGFSCYGMIDNVAVARSQRALPMGLTDGCRMRRSVPADQMITIDDVDVPPDREVDRLRALQDQTFGLA